MTNKIIQFINYCFKRPVKTIVIILFLFGLSSSILNGQTSTDQAVVSDDIVVVAPVKDESVKETPKEDPLSKLNEHEQRIYKACTALDMSKYETAFVLANTNHETAQFKYFEEIDGRSQARKLNYGGGEDWYGRGYIQLTHKSNYEKWSGWTGRDLVSDPNLLVRDLDLSANIACSGIKYGSFTATGKLSSYKQDWYNAREIVNGDKNYKAGCENGQCWTIGTKIEDLTNHYITIIN